MIAELTIRPILRLHNLCYRLAGKYAIALEGYHPKHRILNYEKWFVDRIKLDWTVIDIGCNIGQLSDMMADKVGRRGGAGVIIGIERSKKLVNIARKQFARHNIRYICADATKYDYDFVMVDCIVLSNVLEHIDDRVDFLRKLIREVNWNSKKRFLFRVPALSRSWLAVYKKELGVEYRLDLTHRIEYTHESFSKEMSDSGLMIKSMDMRFGEIYAECEVEQ